MIRSMTGFGEAERDTPAGRLRVELKSVNHRFFSAQVRVPLSLDGFEPQIRDWLRARLPRGHVTCSLRLVDAAGQAEGVQRLQLNEARAREYLRVLQSLKQRLDLPGEVDLSLLCRYNDLILPADEETPEWDAEDVRAVVDEAARAVVALRELEGERLRLDMAERLDSMSAASDMIREQAPARLTRERDRLRRAVAELMGGVEVDDDRLAREVAFMAERWDISEEMVRLQAHVDLFRQTLDADGAEPVGKRLGFLAQEMHREANTIGSKANDAEIEHLVISIKNEIERLREQVENVE